MRVTRGRVLVASLVVAAAAAAAGSNLACSNQLNDQGSISQISPDYAVTIMNADGYPNLTLLCYKGVGFVTSTRDYSAVEHVAGWDAFCATKETATDTPPFTPSATVTPTSGTTGQ